MEEEEEEALSDEEQGTEEAVFSAKRRARRADPLVGVCLLHSWVTLSTRYSSRRARTRPALCCSGALGLLRSRSSRSSLSACCLQRATCCLASWSGGAFS